MPAPCASLGLEFSLIILGSFGTPGNKGDRLESLERFFDIFLDSRFPFGDKLPSCLSKFFEGLGARPSMRHALISYMDSSSEPLVS